MKFVYVTIKVRDMEESLKFYRDIVGLSIDAKISAGPNREIVFLGDGETKVELIEDNGVEDIDLGQDISIGFGVDSLDETMDFVKEKGLEMHSGPFQPNP